MATTTQLKLKITGILLFFYPVIAFSQSLSGVITDSLTREPVGYASIALYNNVQNNKPVTGTISDSTGFFRLEKISKGDYILRINCIGYYQKEIPISVIGRDNIDLKNIELKLDEFVLEEITVTGEQRTVTLKPDKKIIAIDQTMASSGESIAEILKILPEIRVNETITLKNQSFSVYINGKPAGISAQQLFQIPASTAEKVEVMTNPSVKYSPDGLGGIVNIITKKRIAGINGVVQAAARTDNYYGGALMLNYGAEKFNLFTTLFPSYFNTNIDGYSNTFTHDAGSLEETIIRYNKNLYTNFKLGFDLDITKNDFLTLYWVHNPSKTRYTSKIISINKLNPPKTSTINADTDVDNSVSSDALSLNYKHTFAKKGTELSFDFIQSFAGAQSNQNYIMTDDNKIPITAPYRKFYNPDNDLSDITINFTTVLSEKINLNMNAGFNLVLKKEKENRSGEIFINNSWKDSANIRNSFEMNEYIPSVYLLFDFSIKKFEFQTGIRTEYYRRELSFGNQKNNTLYNLYPNFAVSYSVNDNNSLNMSYTRRIDRPYLGQLTPVNNETDYVSSRLEGNENLKPVFSNSFEMGYSFNKSTWGINTSISYMDTKDDIDFVYYNIGDIRYERYENVADVKTLMFNGGINWKYKALSLYLTGSAYNTEYRKHEEKSNNWNYDIRFVPQLRLKGYNFNMQAIYYGAHHYAYYRTTESFRVSLGASKTIKKLTFTLRALNLFRKILRTYSWSETFTNEKFYDNNDTAIFQAGILYKFGKEQKRRVRTYLNTNPIQLNR